jgi:hypothetical protein
VRVRANLEDRYIPRFNGNQELPTEEQITATIVRPTAAQMESLKGYQVEAGTGLIKISFATERILKNHVPEITNLEDDYNGEVQEIRTGNQLAKSKNPRLRPLVDELKAEVTADLTLNEDEQKN